MVSCFFGGLKMTNNYKDFLKFINIDDDTIIVTDIELKNGIKYIHMQRNPLPTFCPYCSSRMHSKGFYTRKINHPILQDSTEVMIILKQRKWHCPQCGTYINESFPFIDKHKQSTNMTSFMIIKAMKDLQRTTSSIAKQFNLSDTQVHNIFTSLVDLKRLPLPKYMSIDEVYLNISECDKYAFVIMDFETGEIVDIVHNRRKSTLYSYFYNIPEEERRNVVGIISDAYQPYLDLKSVFPNSISILDSFHVSKNLISKLNAYIYYLQKKFSKRDKEFWIRKTEDMRCSSPERAEDLVMTLLRQYRWVLLKNRQEINYSPYRNYHKLLKLYADTYEIENLFFAIDPKLKILRNLKEEYIMFNSCTYTSKDEAFKELDDLIKKYKASNESIFEEFAEYLSEHREEIINSFIVTKVRRGSIEDQNEYYARLSNGPMESFNRKPKDYKRSTRGTSNFHYTRNRILWSTRKDAPILGIPKCNEQIHSYKLDKKAAKRRPKKYNKNKQ